MHGKQAYQSELFSSMPDQTGHLAIYIAENNCKIACCSRSLFLTKLAVFKNESQQYPHRFIQQVFAKHQELFARNFQSVHIGIQTKNFTLLPQDTTIADSEVMDFLTQSPTRKAYSNNIEVTAAKTVYSLPAHLVDVIEENFEKFKLFHCSKFAVENCFESQEAYIHIEDQYFDCVMRNGNQLLSATRHTYSTKNDLLYFLLLALKDANKKPEATTIRASGQIKIHDELYSFLENYIQKIEIKVLPGNVRTQADFQLPLQEHQYLLNLLHENH